MGTLTRFSALSSTDRKSAAEAKAEFDHLLAKNPKVTHLTCAAESKLGIMRMVAIRRIQLPKSGRGNAGKQKNIQIIP